MLRRHHTGEHDELSMIHYPSVSAAALLSGSAVRMAAHSDTGSLTLLFQHEVSGLEIADMRSTTKFTNAAVEREARFERVPPRLGAVLVNVGYLLMVWSNRRWRNTVHRVSEPEVAERKEGDLDGMVPDRYSMAYFCSPDSSAVIEPFPSCCCEENPKRWGHIKAGDWYDKKDSSILPGLKS